MTLTLKRGPATLHFVDPKSSIARDFVVLAQTGKLDDVLEYVYGYVDIAREGISEEKKRERERETMWQIRREVGEQPAVLERAAVQLVRTDRREVRRRAARLRRRAVRFPL